MAVLYFKIWDNNEEFNIPYRIVERETTYKGGRDILVYEDGVVDVYRKHDTIKRYRLKFQYVPIEYEEQVKKILEATKIYTDAVDGTIKLYVIIDDIVAVEKVFKRYLNFTITLQEIITE